MYDLRICKLGIDDRSVLLRSLGCIPSIDHSLCLINEIDSLVSRFCPSIHTQPRTASANTLLSFMSSLLLTGIEKCGALHHFLIHHLRIMTVCDPVLHFQESTTWPQVPFFFLMVFYDISVLDCWLCVPWTSSWSDALIDYRSSALAVSCACFLVSTMRQCLCHLS